MNTRERIDSLLSRAREAKSLSGAIEWYNGYITALNELKLTVKPSERSITDETS